MKFSIVMLMYKQSQEVIERAIYSIINQTYSNWELIIFDNGCEKDSILKEIYDLMEKDNRIIYFKSEMNVGWPKGISLCLEKATGDIFGFIVDDDYLESEALGYALSEFKEIYILWVGQKYDMMENGVFTTIGKDSMPNVYLKDKREICEFLSRFFNSVYYNSMQHYIKMDLHFFE